MRAVRIVAYGGPDALVVEDVETPRPGPGEVLVEVRAAAVNPVDVANLAGRVQSAVKQPAVAPPRTAGRDYAGVVVDGPDHLRGLEVWGTSGGLGVTRDGTQAEYLVVPEHTVRPKPANLFFEQAAAVGVSHSVAYLALAERANLQAGETVLVTGASGTVGRAATDIAHWRGATVIGADRRLADDLLADLTVDTTSSDLVEAVREATGGVGVDAALDTVGGDLLDSVSSALRHGGRATVIASLGTLLAPINILDFYRNERALFGVNTLDLSLTKAADVLDVLRRGFEAGVLHAPRTVVFPFDEASSAYKAVAAGTDGAKVVLVP
ncbi:NADPH:quinone reductase [Pseudonocardia thermophila]|jgi:NADPH:quinone reductase and related Zn-dependent oxidoreductases|uniref:NADPH:quinone reductase n=1 Tax=Pseudonocardia thermophila TaxID=1848 RepID=A0A1M6P3E5_PSETH|nr:zinc-binding alcohol dehydrogenase family protein [Pseudonocardia thermophila]SHK02402.1 NADPH:quinone reductase [Pseudonocardia thermophila]